jgi:hypothetical protein
MEAGVGMLAGMVKTRGAALKERTFPAIQFRGRKFKGAPGRSGQKGGGGAGADDSQEFTAGQDVVRGKTFSSAVALSHRISIRVRDGRNVEGKVRAARQAEASPSLVFLASESAEPTVDMNIFLDNWTFSATTWGALRLLMPPM